MMRETLRFDIAGLHLVMTQTGDDVSDGVPAMVQLYDRDGHSLGQDTDVWSMGFAAADWVEGIGHTTLSTDERIWTESAVDAWLLRMV